jgi:hypothetical protein
VVSTRQSDRWQTGAIREEAGATPAWLAMLPKAIPPSQPISLVEMEVELVWTHAGHSLSSHPNRVFQARSGSRVCVLIRRVQTVGLFSNRQPAECEPCCNFPAAAPRQLGLGTMQRPGKLFPRSAITARISAWPRRPSQPWPFWGSPAARRLRRRPHRSTEVRSHRRPPA